VLPDPVVFSVEEDVDADRLGRWVGGLGPSGPARATDRTLLDTFDARLHRHGLTLWREARRRAPGVTLVLESSGQPTISAMLTVADPDRILARHLPDGPLADRLRPVVAERALLPRVRLRSRVHPLKVCNGDGKTVVRMDIEAPALVRRGQPELVLDKRLHVTAVLGYDRDLERVVSSLTAKGQLRPGGAPLATVALEAAGLPATGTTSEVDVALDPGMRADRAMALICSRLADVVEVNLPGVLDDTDTEFLHDMRVAVRRSRSVLKEMRDVLAPDAGDRARVDLRWVQEVTGPTRDLDVLLHDWPEMVAPVPSAMTGDLQPLVDLLSRERRNAFVAMRRHLRSRRFNAAWSAWRDTISPPPAATVESGAGAAQQVGNLAGGRIVSVYRSMARAGAAIDDSSPAEALHDLRKRGKELRYLLELFGGLWPNDRVKPLVSALKGLQDVLGHFQDDEIQVGELRSLGPALAATPGGTDSLIALGFVVEGLRSRQMQARSDFARRFADFARPENRTMVTETFAADRAARRS
jgi:CHAD domain-containing protein